MNDGTNCIKCGRPSATFIRYSGSHLSEEHFNVFLEKRVKKEIRLQGLFSPGGIIAVAITGGKDSVVTLRCLSEIARDHRDITIKAIIVDEGIDGYRPSSVLIAKQVCKEMDVELHEASFRELFGLSLDEIVKLVPDVNPCAVCGVFRRYALNTAARDMGAQKIATGHNLDDLAQSIFMNVLNSDLDKLRRLGPHTRVIPGLIPRSYPLRTVPEKEVLLYALLNGLPLHSSECPYSLQATRGRYRDILAQLEMDSPGTKHSLLNFHRSMMEQCIPPDARGERQNCSECGEPAASDECKKCHYLRLIKEADEKKRA